MGKISTSIEKNSFSKNNIANYKLSILCGVDSLCYCIGNQSNEILVLKKFDLYKTIKLEQANTYTSSFNEIWETDSFLSLPFPTIHIAFIHSPFTIIPNRLYQKENKAAYLSPLKTPANTPEVYQANELANLDAKLIFSLPKSTIDFFNSKYSDVAYFNSFAPLINGIAKKMQTSAGKHIWLNIHPNVLQIILFDGQELIFSNQFPFQSENDFIYYILLVYNQFKLNPEEVPLHISGQLVKESAIYKKLYSYIRHLSFLNVSETHQLNKQLTDSPSYFFFDLLSIESS